MQRQFIAEDSPEALNANLNLNDGHFYMRFHSALQEIEAVKSGL